MGQKAIEVQAPLYGLEAIQKACYSFLERAYIRLEGDPAGKISVRFRLKEEAAQADLNALIGDFENELIHQALRVRVTAANQKIREYIVTRALTCAEGAGSNGSAQDAQKPAVLDEELEKEIEKLLAEVEKGGDEDPLKIAVPWEQKQSAEPTEASAGSPPVASGEK